MNKRKLVTNREINNRVMYIDPPSGWRYGFPKVYPEEAQGRTKEWLVENGYPQSEIDKMKEHFYCRYWEGEKDE
jgi:hypothetical protein